MKLVRLDSPLKFEPLATYNFFFPDGFHNHFLLCPTNQNFLSKFIIVDWKWSKVYFFQQKKENREKGRKIAEKENMVVVPMDGQPHPYTLLYFYTKENLLILWNYKQSLEFILRYYKQCLEFLHLHRSPTIFHNSLMGPHWLGCPMYRHGSFESPSHWEEGINSKFPYIWVQ